jgi:hypothetical protein
MRYSEIIESFDSTVPYTMRDVSNDDVACWIGEFMIDDGLFKVGFKMPYYNRPAWELSFTRNDDFKLTGTGSANLVISTVIAITGDFIKRNHPRYIYFSANHSEPSRVKLYPLILDALVKRFPEFMPQTKLLRKRTEFSMSRPPDPFIPEIVPKPKEPLTDPVWDDDLEEFIKELESKSRARQ